MSEKNKLDETASSEGSQEQAAPVSGAGRKVHWGVVEFHSERLNPGLIELFFSVTDDLRKSGSIVDVWLMDIAQVLENFGYRMEIYSTAKPAQSTVQTAGVLPETAPANKLHDEHLSSYAFAEYGDDAKLYNGIHALEWQLAEVCSQRDAVRSQLDLTIKAADALVWTIERVVDLETKCAMSAYGNRDGWKNAQLKPDREMFRRIEDCRAALAQYKAARDLASGKEVSADAVPSQGGRD